MPCRYQKIPKEMLKKLKDKINAKLMSRVESIVTKKCKAIFEKKKPMISKTAIQTELRIFQSRKP